MRSSARRPRSHPNIWRYRPVPRAWRATLSPQVRRPSAKGRATTWTVFRRVIWSWWPWTALCVWSAWSDQWWWALAGALLAVFTFLAAPVEFPPRYGLGHAFAVDAPEFLTTMAGTTGVVPAAGNRVELLNNGDRFYPSMLHAISCARESITIEAYIYWSGEIGLKFAEALAERARAGVAVKVLLDAVGSSSLGRDVLEILKRGGCQVAWYNPIRWNSLGRINHRTHRKSLIVDGRVGFTGGAGIADQWRGNAEDPDHWRDLQIRIEGPAVLPLQTGFAQNWLECTGELVVGSPFFPPPSPAGSVQVQTIMSSPETGASTVRIMYCLSIMSATRSILIANPYFVPDQLAIDLLVDARTRGVAVRVMVSGQRNDNELAHRNSVWLYGPLLEGGVEILEYNRTLLHQKTMVVDGLWATVGTTNFDSRSFAHNEETNVCFLDPDLAQALERDFAEDAKACHRVTLEEWQARGFLPKALDAAATFFRDQV